MSDGKSESNNVPSFNNTLSFKVAPRTSNKVVTSSSSLPDSFNKAKEEHRSETVAVEDKDYVIEAEGKTFRSSTTTQKCASKLVIPMIAKNKWKNEAGADDEEDSLDQAAADEIMNDLKATEHENVVGDISHIPLMMRNRLPAPKDGRDMDERYDISIRPEESTLDDYNNIPVSSFGSALLRGMGWSEGKAIGNTNKSACEPIEYIPRHKGLGLGAEKRIDDIKLQRKRKIGEPVADDNKYKPVVEKDGRVRHIKKVGEVVDIHVKGVVPGSYVMILKNPHKGLNGKVISVDGDTARISVKLAISGEIIHLSQYNAQLIDEEHFKTQNKDIKTQNMDLKTQNNNAKGSSSMSSNGDVNRGSNDEKKGQKNINHIVSNGNPTWMQRDIRVRIISRSFKAGRYYNKKVNIIEVISLDRCMCKTDENKILDNVHESYLETVVPRTKGSYVKILHGKYKGQYGKLVDRKKSECLATLQMLSSKEIATVSFDNISEFIGRLPSEEVI